MITRKIPVSYQYVYYAMLMTTLRLVDMFELPYGFQLLKLRGDDKCMKVEGNLFWEHYNKPN